MEDLSYYSTAAAFAVVIACWFTFASLFVFRKRPEAAPDAVKAPRSWLGIILQGVSFGCVWGIRRQPIFSNVVPNDAVNIALQIVAVILVIACVYMTMAAVRELGKQWSLEARLVEGHKLITSGPYSLVRHPIYTAMFGMLIATGIVITHWIGIVIAIVLFLTGTFIRTRFEERLLGDAFGEEFTSWKRRVPGLIPYLKF